jgi:beta-glucosidase
MLGHYYGVHAPGIRDLRALAHSMHHVLLAHGAGIEALRSENATNLGIVLNLEFTEPETDTEDDLAAADLWDGLFNRWYLDGVLAGRYPTDITDLLEPYLPEGWSSDLGRIAPRLDWLGINYYTRAMVHHDPSQGLVSAVKVDGPLEKTDSGWEIYPDGLLALLRRVWRDYAHHPIYVTENGMAEVQGLDDRRRKQFHANHLEAVRRAREEGIDVRGYFAWSLLDNFEWAEGYTKRFGLVEVDFETQTRAPRASFNAFKAALQATG